jgi:glutamate/tyrosine decarboxylase-like PLP-dependent enzyme
MAGEKSVLEKHSLRVLARAVDRLEEGFRDVPTFTPEYSFDTRAEAVLMDVASRLHADFPYFHPLYAGQMLKPPHPLARTAYSLAMWMNPNNHALDASQASSPMEKEAVAEIAGMIGWETHLGHLCGGGTVANLEALWVAGQLHPGTVIVASDQAHYTHNRICGVLGLPFEPIPSDSRGRMRIDALERRLEKGGVGMVVATVGSTATGSVDPIPEIIDLRDRYGFRLHADAAYGGYFKLADNLEKGTAACYEKLGGADSVVIDPHKHGMQPYGCGCVLFRDPSVGRLYKHESPYTYFTSSELHLGEISLECSRPGAAAAGLWATQQVLPLEKGGSFAAGLTKGRRAALSLWERLGNDRRFVVPFEPELDIAVWAVRASHSSVSSALARSVFDEAQRLGLHLALAELPIHFFEGKGDEEWADTPTVTCLRSVLMKPEHLEWIDEIYRILDQAVDRAARRR